MTNPIQTKQEKLDTLQNKPVDRIKSGALKGNQSVRTAKKLATPVALGWAKK